MVVGGVFFFIRYRYLTRYSANPNSNIIENDVQQDEIADSIIKKKRRNHNSNSNYLDEFLSAIKIFGYLERPVFHELTKNMTTQKLSWDEILYLDEKLGFSIVVDGCVQVFIKINDNYDNNSQFQNLKDLEFDRDEVLIIGSQKYQLLNEIKSGVPLSTLNSTLDLFNPESTFQSNPVSSASSLDLKDELPIYPEIIARPKFSKHNHQGATIAIIPGSAFQRIQMKYPKATAHIVTMVKNRIFKVTMNVVHNYMGLTDEILSCDTKLNNEIDIQLPNHLKQGLVEKYLPDIDSKSPEPEDTILSISKSNSSLSMRKKMPVLKNLQHQSSTRIVSLNSVAKPNHPGDLISSVPISRKSLFNLDQFQSADPFKEPVYGIEETEESSTKIAIIENLFKILGVDEESSMFKGLLSVGSMSDGSLSSSPSYMGLNNGLNGLVNNPNANNTFNKSQIYEQYTNRARFDSFSSVSSSQSRAASPKIYNTINQKQLNIYNSTRGSNLENIFEMNRTKSNSITKSELIDFNLIKQEFSRFLTIKYFEPGAVVLEQDSFSGGLYYVISGSLEEEYLIKRNERRIIRHCKTIKEGGVAGYLPTIIGIKSLTTLKTPDGALLAYIKKDSWSKLLDKYYQLALPLAIKCKNLFSKQLNTLDFALEYCPIQAGGVLAAEGDQANGFHIIISGRFRVIKSKDENDPKSPLLKKLKVKDNFTVLGEYGHGESIGEVEVLTASRRNSSLIAIRDSETARIPRTLFEILSSQNPSIMVKVSRIVANKVAAAQTDVRQLGYSSTMPSTPTHNSTPFQSPSTYNSGNYKTITILPTVSGLPVREFATKLLESLKLIGRNVIALDQTSILNHLGRHAFDDSLAQLKLSGYFAALEEEYETVLYICDSTVKSTWTSTCISQGDCILLLANADDYDVAVSPGDYEKSLVKYRTTARTDLCLLHPEKNVTHGSTSIWLKNRSWVQGHHHIHLSVSNSIRSERMKKKSLIGDLAAKISESTINSQLRSRIENVRSRLNPSRISQSTGSSTEQVQPYKNDFMRLARLLSNEAVGLILGGGGARGISHLGVVTALERHGIPVDIIGGTSIGAFVGGLYATEYNSVSIYGKVKKFSIRISSIWRSILDLTIPVTSYLTGYEFNRGIWKCLGFAEIEDSWIKFFCNSTNITNSTMDIHETGYLWRFIRASMSLAGLLPPITYNGSMLLDGGYLDNLPVLEMKKRGIKYIIAVDVGAIDDNSPMNYGDTLSGMWVLINRWNPFSKHADIPNMMDIQSRLAYVASVNALEVAKKTPGVKYLRPPIDEYATLDFNKFEQIYKVGLDYAEEIIKDWEQKGELPEIVEKMSKQKECGTKRPSFFRRNSL